MNEGYQKYLDAIEKTNPIGFENGEYMNFAQYKEAVGIHDEEEVHIPLTIRPKKDARPIAASMENYNKVELSKKPKVERKPRVKMSDDEKRKKKNEWRQSYLQSEKGRAKRREINARYAERNRKKLNADAVRRYHEKKNG